MLHLLNVLVVGSKAIVFLRGVACNRRLGASVDGHVAILVVLVLLKLNWLRIRI